MSASVSSNSVTDGGRVEHRTDRLRHIATRVGPFLLTWLILLGYSLRQAPIPAVNEPAYLGKAKHFWDPTYCPGDEFFDSSNPHLIFYLTLGPLTQLMSLFGVALIGRIVGYGLMAWGWSALCFALTRVRWLPPLAVSLFLVLHMTGTFSGEWIVGGIEGKVFAYGFTFWAIAAVLTGRRGLAGFLLGLAICFHAVVGCWAVLAAAVATIADFSIPSGRRTSPAERNSWRGWLAMAALLGVTALPGIVPALGAVAGSENPLINQQANFIHVFIRIKHHVDPMQFRTFAFQLYFGLFVAWIILLRYRRSPVQSDNPRPDCRWFHWFVAATLAFLIAGLLIGWRSGEAADMPWQPLRTWLLKFYPFRLGDVFLPVAVSILVAERLLLWCDRREVAVGGAGDVNTHDSDAVASRVRYVPAVLVGMLAASLAIGVATPDANPSRMPPRMKRDWIDLCRWIDENTPPDALIQAPVRDWAFKWFAQRAQFYSYKDCPQGAEEIVAWYQRRQRMRDWSYEFYDGSFSAEDLAALHDLTGIDYLIAYRRGPFEIDPVYRNDSFRIYRTDGAIGNDTEVSDNSGVDGDSFGPPQQ
ncbi:DUF6798 domain-containing protein [Stratiformator vulcanicus]|uniref:DUF6798 domain-containing protein n=1 Tax=Stratiformator vulcanicus TaxID=2527980 RepID=A0A517R5Z4_9PLAN|nr:DUF6798 domain-containing protein [Stratiformator vulcanicus]QDT39308.1 hypothetical protein Pan189_37140 [Stratiformator vulcanicus]